MQGEDVRCLDASDFYCLVPAALIAEASRAQAFDQEQLSAASTQRNSGNDSWHLTASVLRVLCTEESS